MKFAELSDTDKIQSIKDGFVLILESVANNPDVLKEYIKVEDPILEAYKDDMSPADYKNLEEKNKVLQDKFTQQKAEFDKVQSMIADLKMKTGCICGKCVDINITNNSIPPELQVLVEAARKEVQNRVF